MKGVEMPAPVKERPPTAPAVKERPRVEPQAPRRRRDLRWLAWLAGIVVVAGGITVVLWVALDDGGTAAPTGYDGLVISEAAAGEAAVPENYVPSGYRVVAGQEGLVIHAGKTAIAVPEGYAPSGYRVVTGTEGLVVFDGVVEAGVPSGYAPSGAGTETN